jgi:hypothetical protein
MDHDYYCLNRPKLRDEMVSHDYSNQAIARDRPNPKKTIQVTDAAIPSAKPASCSFSVVVIEEFPMFQTTD